MEKDQYCSRLKKILIPQKKIQEKIKEIARRIGKDYSEAVLVCNLKGGFRFLSDLVTFINIPVVIDFIAFTSYEGTAPSGEIRIIKDLKVNVENRDLILIEDIVDTGLTVKRILEYLKSFKSPRSVKICTLLDKQPARKVDVEPDYIGFRVEDRFVVGYGLDFNEYYRELNDIYLYEEGA